MPRKPLPISTALGRELHLEPREMPGSLFSSFFGNLTLLNHGGGSKEHSYSLAWWVGS